METVVFSRKNWVWRFMCEMDGSLRWDPPADICAFTRSFLWQLSKALFCLSLVVAIDLAAGATVIERMTKDGYVISLFGTVIPFEGGMAWKFFMAFVLGLIALLIIVVLGLAALFTIVGIGEGFKWLGKQIRNYNRARWEAKMELRYAEGYKEPEPGPLYKAYRSWKDKTCFRIIFE